MGSSLDEVLEALGALLDARAQTPPPRPAGEGNFRCEGCVECSHCRFCIDCVDCDDCTYCERCEGCQSCTHCLDCLRCEKVTHSAWSADCEGSSYLTLCSDCEDCVQCFACVDLEGGEFCILNEKLPRKAYFSRVAALRGALEERIRGGWLPPWAEELRSARADDDEALDEEVDDGSEDLDEPERADEELADEVQGDEARGPDADEQSPAEPVEITVDMGPSAEPPTPKVQHPPWSFDDAPKEPTLPSLTPTDDPPQPAPLPEPPPFQRPSGSTERHTEYSHDDLRDALIGADFDDLVPLEDDSRDRYGWSAQAEDTPSPPNAWPPARSRPLRPIDELDDPVHDARPLFDWPEPDNDLGEARGAPVDDLERRRRETAASPGAVPDYAVPFSSGGSGPLSDVPMERHRGGWRSDEELGHSGRRSDTWDGRDAWERPAAHELVPEPAVGELPDRGAGPEDQTEPDAPVSRGGRPGRRLPSEPVPTVHAAEPGSSPHEEATAAPTPQVLRSGRRPQRPAPPEATHPGMRRGRAPQRPTPPDARQADAPSMRRARRPARGDREEEPTAPHPAGARETVDP